MFSEIQMIWSWTNIMWVLLKSNKQSQPTWSQQNNLILTIYVFRYKNFISYCVSFLFFFITLYFVFVCKNASWHKSNAILKFCGIFCCLEIMFYIIIVKSNPHFKLMRLSFPQQLSPVLAHYYYHRPPVQIQTTILL